MALAFVGVSMAILIYLAHLDYWNLRVPNRGIFSLLALWGAQTYWLPDGFWYQDLIVAGVLFSGGLLFWRLGKLNASEAKLLLVAGLHLGVLGAIVFASSLPILFTLQHLFLLTWKQQSFGHHPFWRRLRILQNKGRVPAGPAIIVAAIIGLIGQQILTHSL
ncbi:MAG TPA: hypothetical protein DE179_05365 [Oceanospirillaceae bacterium]|nr:hypothetical protein [Oceanospirillaceae bacterium]